MLTEYKGVKVEEQNRWLSRIGIEGHYDMKKNVIYIRPGKNEAAVLEHEYRHYLFGQRHRWLGKFALNDNLFVAALAYAAAFRMASIALLAIPFMLHEVQVEQQTTKRYGLALAYAAAVISIIAAVLIGGLRT